MVEGGGDECWLAECLEVRGTDQRHWKLETESHEYGRAQRLDRPDLRCLLSWLHSSQIFLSASFTTLET